MTPEQTTAFNSSIQAVYDVLQSLPLPGTVPDHDLYEPLKALHDASIAPWCLLVDFLSSDCPLQRPQAPPKPSVSDFVV